jgi:hypothetical protein
MNRGTKHHKTTGCLLCAGVGISLATDPIEPVHNGSDWPIRIVDGVKPHAIDHGRFNFRNEKPVGTLTQYRQLGMKIGDS